MKAFTLPITFVSISLLHASTACITGGGNLLGNACEGLYASASLTDNGALVCSGESWGPQWGPYSIPCIAGYQMWIMDSLAENIVYETPHGNFEFSPDRVS